MGWEEIAADKKKRIDESIPKEWRVEVKDQNGSLMDLPASSGLLSSDELEITNSSAVDLVAKLASGQLKSVDVTLAFCKRAALAHQALNLALEFFPDMALAQAKELDKYYEEHKKPVGPLHGLPISLKDQLRVKGLETSMGYVSWVGKYDEEDSVLTALLRKAGAVFYIKTSVPQSLMVCETVNNIIGRTLNPRNKNWSCGGSSGGEGANIGFRGGIIGVGTDIGGSIRVPSAFNFLYGIRPSHGRMPYAKMANSMEGQETVHSVVGPLAHSVPDLKLFVTSVLQEEPWKYDSKVIPMPWRQGEEDAISSKIQNGGLTLGFYNCDGNVLPHPPILRGVDMVVSALKDKGHTVVPWKPYKHDFAVDLINKIYAADGGADVFSDIKKSGEPAIPNFKDLISPDLPKLDMNEAWDAQRQKWAYQGEYLEQWRVREAELGKEIDAFIAPITPTAAIRHNQFKYYGYASAINLLDWTSVVVPVTFADKDKDKKQTDYKPLSEMDGTVQAEYDPEAYHGAPVAVQIVGRRLSEERILAIAQEIGKLLGNETTP
ncbi:Acetamidase [Exophiala xenobiotica]|nr:Acetamidase [Exophiala xenobiotica]KAK5221623.1 Acetamidase [Exophiala xenobiotica]KAK5245726.1 Acetamidase [Exophiala xenobiotica]KAK5320651.1 Acetamidase [Exophiala xenobiotica]KAK5351880.1 Acetamidase [Exophiala xenobiotica]